MNNKVNESNLEIPLASLNYYRDQADITVLNSTLQRLENKKRSDNEEELYKIIKTRINAVSNENIEEVLKVEKTKSNVLSNVEILKVKNNSNNNVDIIKFKSNGIEKYYEIPKENLSRVIMVLRNSTRFISEQEITKRLMPLLKEANLETLNMNNIDIQKTLNEEKEKNNVLENIEVLKVSEYLNEKDNYGFRNEMNIIKIKNSNNIALYEVPKENLIKIETILKNSKDFKTEQELLDKLNPYLTLMNQTLLDLNNFDLNKELNNSYNVEEIKSVKSNSDRVYKERKLLNQFMEKRGIKNLEVKTSSNSRGERVYTIGSTVIRFLGDNLDMYILNSKGNDKVSTQDYDKDLTEKDIKNVEFSNINDYMNQVEKLQDIADRIYVGAQTKEDEEFFENFIRRYIEDYKSVDVYAPLVQIYDTFYNSEKYVNDNIDIMINTERNKELEDMEIKKSNVQALKLENNENNYGFANIIYIIVSIIVTISIIAYLFLVNK